HVVEHRELENRAGARVLGWERQPADAHGAGAVRGHLVAGAAFGAGDDAGHVSSACGNSWMNSAISTPQRVNRKSFCADPVRASSRMASPQFPGWFLAISRKSSR